MEHADGGILNNLNIIILLGDLSAIVSKYNNEKKQIEESLVKINILNY